MSDSFQYTFFNFQSYGLDLHLIPQVLHVCFLAGASLLVEAGSSCSIHNGISCLSTTAIFWCPSGTTFPLQPNNLAFSTHACTTLAWVLLEILACLFCFFFFLILLCLLSLLILLLRSASGQIQDSRICIFLPSSVPKSRYSSLSSLFCSPKLFIAFLQI